MKNAPGMYLGVGLYELLRECDFWTKPVFQAVMASALCSLCFGHFLQLKFSNLAKGLL